MLYLPIKNGKECKHRKNLLLQYMFQHAGCKTRQNIIKVYIIHGEILVECHLQEHHYLPLLYALPPLMKENLAVKFPQEKMTINVRTAKLTPLSYVLFQGWKIKTFYNKDIQDIKATTNVLVDNNILKNNKLFKINLTQFP